MKLKHSLFIAGSFLLTAISTQAQRLTSTISEKSKLGQSIRNKADFNPAYRAITPNQVNKAAKTTADSFSRPIGYMNKYFYNSNWEISDSLFITWKGDHAKNVNLFDYDGFNAGYMNPANDIAYMENYTDQIVYNRHFEVLPIVTNSYQLFNEGGLYDYLTEYHYDANERLEKAFVNATDSVIYTYDSNNKLILQKNHLNGNIETDSATYDANGNLTNFITISPSGNSYHYSYEYDNANILIKKQYQSFDNNNVLQMGTIDSIFYPSNTVDSHIVFEYWNNVWEKEQISISTKNTTGQTIKIESYNANTLDEYFVAYIEHNLTGLSKKIYYTELTDTFEIYDIVYNSNGDVLEMNYDSKWNNDTMQKEEKHTVTYNAENLPLTAKYQSNYNDSTSTWEDVDYDQNMVFYYEMHGVEDTTTSIRNIHTSNIAVYPNPAMSQLNITVDNETIQSISIYDAMGRIVRSYQVPNKANQTIHIATLVTGHYLLQVRTNKGIANTKFIKE